jgi:TolB protein
MLPRSSSDPASSQNWFTRVFNHAGLLGLAVVLVITGYTAWPLLQVQVQDGRAGQSRAKAISPRNIIRVPLRTAAPAATGTAVPVEASPSSRTAPMVESPLDEGVFILSLDEGGYSHLFAYHPRRLPLTRLTYGPWDDVAPAVSPDGTRLAFASNRDGPWDLYLLELASGDVSRLTDTPEYDGSPTWSPDGEFLAYETYSGNLAIYILAVAGDRPPVSLSEGSGADFSPSWSPVASRIAFVSDRSGEREIWLAELDEAEPTRFTNLSQQPHAAEARPAWSPDGRLAWAAVENGSHNLYILDGLGEVRRVGSGDWPVWSPDGSVLLTSLEAPNQVMLAAYGVTEGSLVLPPVNLPGALDGLAWLASSLPDPLAPRLILAANTTPPAPWHPAVSPLSDMPPGRHHLIPLYEVSAPFPQLHDMVDESFQTLRTRLAAETGWDVLATLENAFVPLTAPLGPGMGEDWLYTGRAFAFSPLPMDAGWLVVLPEDFGGERYWQVYARAILQDGSQGKPLYDPPWDFNARYSSDPRLYQQGGAPVGGVPMGYWVNVTRMAAVYGWERLPALSTWQAYYPAARFNEFVHSGGQEWYLAMLELYPVEALLTPTPLTPPTLTPTPTSAWLQATSTAPSNGLPAPNP